MNKLQKFLSVLLAALLFLSCAPLSVLAEEMLETLRTLPLPEPDRTEVMERMEMQIANAREWRDIVNTFFHRFSGVDDAQGRKIFE